MSRSEGKYGPEYFYPGRHLRGMVKYNGYISIKDSDVLIKADFKTWGRAEFRFTKLFHATNFKGVTGVLHQQRFCESIGKEIEGEEMHFSWWSVAVDTHMITEEKRRRRNVLPYADGDYEIPSTHKFLDSPAFQDTSRYGNYKFTYDIAALIAQYERQMCPYTGAEVSVLGTYQYKAENMHAVVVHAADDPVFQHFPRIQNNPIAVVSQTPDGEWVWRPNSTSSEIPRHLRTGHRFRSWDHLSFAFHLPNEKQEFWLPNLRKHLSFCEIAKPNLSREELSVYQANQLLEDWDRWSW